MGGNMGTDYTPRPKVAAGAGIGTPLGVVVVWVLGMFIEVPDLVAGAMGALCVAIVAYMWRDDTYVAKDKL
jgi:hypothetical protein